MNGSKTVLGIDIAKRVFQLHGIDSQTGEIMDLTLKREQFPEHFANRQKCLMNDARAFRSARGFTAFAGLVPRQTGTEGKNKLVGISNPRPRPVGDGITPTPAAEWRGRGLGPRDGAHDLGNARP
jgi:transposase